MSLKDTLPGVLGFGTAPLGNMFRAIPEEEAQATVEAAWSHGVRYFDTAPFYGSGLSEIRLGQALSNYHRDDYVLSTKVGRVILDEVEETARDLGEKSGVFEHGRPNKIINDYSADATLRSIEDSLTRLQTDRLDIVWVHDIAQDFLWRPMAGILQPGPHWCLQSTYPFARARCDQGVGAGRQSCRALRIDPGPDRSPA